LDKGADPKKIEAGMPKLVEKYVVPEVQHDMNVSLAEAQKSIKTFLFVLQPLREIHFHGMSSGELEHNGDVQYVYVFSALAVFILVLAAVNFINLSTAIASRRGKEVGIRKVMGSPKSQLEPGPVASQRARRLPVLYLYHSHHRHDHRLQTAAIYANPEVGL
jgi:putative ABC transport system permease protein